MKTISRTIKDTLVQRLRHEIIQGNLVPGQRLRHDELAEIYGVSTMPIREALRELEAEGLVTLTPHRTAEVTQLTADDLEDIYDIRIALEAMATRLAVPRLGPATLAHLDDCIDQIDHQNADVATLVWLNHDFHTSLYAAAGRPHLSELLMILRHRTQHYLHTYITVCGGLPLAQEEHRAILAAARRGDAEEAGRVMRDHIASVAEALIQYVRQTPAGPARSEGS
jgi:DNA-binding GntR family transcriptional regulator